MLRKLLFAGAFSVVSVPAVLAADIEAPPAVIDWSGFYAGAHVGYGDPSFDGVFDSGEDEKENRSFPEDIDADGILGGVQAGFNVQMDSLVLGAEADFSFTDFSGDTKDGGFDGLNDDQRDRMDTHIDWLASLRARAGFAVDNLLFYATGGVAYTEPEFNFHGSVDDETGSGTVQFDAWGYVLGGGIEWAAMENTSFRIEGLYYGFDKKKNI